MSNTTFLEYNDELLEIEFYYEPSEPQVPYYKDGSGYPGYGGCLDIESIKKNGVECHEDYTEKEIDEMEDIIFKQCKNKN